VGCNVIDPKAVEFIASKVAASCGDARQLLALTSSAVSKCQASLISGKETTCDKPIVTLKHMMLAVKDTIQKWADIIDGLPQMAKIILCVAVTLTQAGPDWNVIRLGKLKNFCSAALREDLYDEDLSVDTFAGLVQQLFDAGLLLSGQVEPMDVSMHDYSSLYSMPIRLGVQLYDVESALEQTLGEQDFYRGLLQKIRSTDLKNVKTN
jgi:cell division control protein 6